MARAKTLKLNSPLFTEGMTEAMIHIAIQVGIAMERGLISTGTWKTSADVAGDVRVWALEFDNDYLPSAEGTYLQDLDDFVEDKLDMLVELRACPFCGSDAAPSLNKCNFSSVFWYRVKCEKDSGGCGAVTAYAKEKTYAIKKWSQRHG